ncbi:MAG: TlpA disulfide reductase family protein [Gammaproteobacteria bacterium]|nr:TlpA disulfide reductase family protein [Gammaproteobacteria bacterium]
MNKTLQYSILLCLTLLLYSCDQGQHNVYSIIGTIETVDIPNADRNEELSDIEENAVDWGSAKIVVTQAITNSTGEIATVELASGTFEDGEVTLSGDIDQPTEVEITATTDGADPLTLDAVIAPEANLSFLLIEYPAFNSASMDFLGESRKVLDPSNRFSVFGDLSSIDGDLERATLRVTAWEYDKLGEQVTLNYGRVLLDEGNFFVEASVDEPKVVNILVILPASQEYTQFHAIVEPGAEIEIIPQSSWLNDLSPVSGTGKHAQLVESWRQSEEYLGLKQEYQIAYLEYQENTQNGEDSTSTGEEETPKYLELRRQLNRIRYDYLEDVASNATDPMDALLALELSAYWGSEEALPIYDRLTKSLDKDLVMRRVTQDRNFHSQNLASRGIDRSLVVGKNVPDFTLPNLNGEQISLDDLQKQNEIVLVEFWASWCGPCIEAIPALKDLYSTYHKHGFEIVSVSIDDEQDSWIEASGKYELPWINLGELAGWNGEVATSFGVTFIPKNYLVNTQGEIVEKDLTSKALDEWLANRFEEKAEEDVAN